MRGKKGDLKDEVPMIIIAVIGIALLVIGVIRLYDYVKNQDTENAKKTINYIEEQIKALPTNGQISEITFAGFKSDSNWAIIGWSKTDSRRPEKCLFGSCICICPKLIRAGDGPFFTMPESNEVLCQKSGFCREFEQEKVFVKDSYWAKLATTARGGTETRIVEAVLIRLPSNLLALKVNKTQSVINITHSEA